MFGVNSEFYLSLDIRDNFNFRNIFSTYIILRAQCHSCNRGFWGFFSSAAKREVPCYLPGSFTSSGPDLLHRNIAFVVDLDSFSYKQNSKAFTEEHLSYKTRSQ